MQQGMARVRGSKPGQNLRIWTCIRDADMESGCSYQSGHWHSINARKDASLCTCMGINFHHCTRKLYLGYSSTQHLVGILSHLTETKLEGDCHMIPNGNILTAESKIKVSAVFLACQYMRVQV